MALSSVCIFRLNDPDLGNTTKVLLVLMVFILSVASYLLIEKPCRSSKRVGNRLIITALIVVVMTTAVTLSHIIDNEGYPERYNLSARTHADMRYYQKDYWNDFSRFLNDVNEIPDSFPDMVGSTNILVIGNSWAHDIAYSLAGTDHMNVIFQGSTGQRCVEFVLPMVSTGHKDYAKWLNRCVRNSDRFGKVPANTDIIILADNIYSNGQYDDPVIRNVFEDNIRRLSMVSSAPVVVVKGRPVWNGGGYKLMLELPSLSRENNSLVQDNLGIAYEEMQAIAGYYRNFYSSYGVEFLSLVDAFCAEDGVCELFSDNEVYYFDAYHLTREGSDAVRGYLKDSIDTIFDE